MFAPSVFFSFFDRSTVRLSTLYVRSTQLRSDVTFCRQGHVSLQASGTVWQGCVLRLLSVSSGGRARIRAIISGLGLSHHRRYLFPSFVLYFILSLSIIAVMFHWV